MRTTPPPSGSPSSMPGPLPPSTSPFPPGSPTFLPAPDSGSNFYVNIEQGRVNRVPDAARDRFDEGPLTPSDMRRQPGGGLGPPVIPPLPAPAGRSPFAPVGPPP